MTPLAIILLVFSAALFAVAIFAGDRSE